MITHLYRYYGYGTPDYMRAGIDLMEYKVLKETPNGYWIEHFDGIRDKKWVTKEKCFKFAYETKEEAMVNFFGRKVKQIRILKANLAQAKAERKKIRQMIVENNITLPLRLKPHV